MVDIQPLQSKPIHKALLVGVYRLPSERTEAQSLLDELSELVDTLGAQILEKNLLHLREPQARFFIGSGKAEELSKRAKELGVDAVIFDPELSPAQQRNWEKLSSLRVIDRQEVILDIFAKRAQTREARLQIALAQMQYVLPRLTRGWSHFGQQAGGIGGKGEGETQLELDKRMLRAQIERIKSELVNVRRRRATQRKGRERVPVPTFAIVGYTNAGKSSLLRRLTEANVLVEDKLFATLDTTTRKLMLPSGKLVLLTDTVGFVRQLPHRLVEAFNATLEEAIVSDFLIHLIDASHPLALEFYHTTTNVLAELGAQDKKSIILLNKIDQVADTSALKKLQQALPDALPVSVKTGEGLEKLVRLMEELTRGDQKKVYLKIPLHEQEAIARLHAQGRVLKIEYLPADACIEASIPLKLLPEYQAWVDQAHTSNPSDVSGRLKSAKQGKRPLKRVDMKISK